MYLQFVMDAAKTIAVLACFVFGITRGYQITETYETSQRMPRITGGWVSEKGEFPFLVIISNSTLKEDRIGSYQCGGSIYNKWTIVTTASCVSEFSKHEEIFITAGEYIVSRVDNSEQVVSVEKIVVHDKYEEVRKRNDIALLVLRKPLVFNTWVGAVELATAEEVKDTVYATIAGWGRTEYEYRRPSDYLLKTETFKARNEAKCSILFPGFDPKTQICAGDNRNACSGDWGGPLLSGKQGHYKQIGIASYGLRCSDNPAVYTDVSSHTEWILAKAKI